MKMTRHTPIEVTSKEIAPCEWQITVAVPSTRVTEEFDHAYQGAARGMKIPGFRPGKAPVAILRATLGDSVLEDARQHLFEHVMGDAVREAKLSVLRVKDFDPNKFEVKESQDLNFSFEVETAPPITLPNWEDVQIESQDTEPSEEEVDSALQSIAHQNVQFDDADKGIGLGEELVAKCSLVYEKDGEKGPIAEDLKLGLDSPLYGVDEDLWKETMKGAQAGDEKSLAVTFHEGFSNADWVGQEGLAVLQVLNICKPRPATAEEIAENAQMKGGVEELRNRISEQVQMENEQRERNRVVESSFDRVLEMEPFQLAPTMVEEEAKHAFEQQVARATREGGLEAEAARNELEKHRGELDAAAERRLKIFFLVREIARQQKFQVSKKDLDHAYRAIGMRHGLELKAVKKLYREQGRSEDLTSDILEGKVRDFLIQKHQKKCVVEGAAQAE